MKPEAVTLYEKLAIEWNKKPPNLEKCVQLLNDLKLIIIEMGFIPSVGTKFDAKELHLTRDVLEIGALCSLARSDTHSFERYISQLKTFYFDFKNEIAESPYKYQLIGLHLLCLLSSNRLAEFHTELELLEPKLIQNNIYIKHPVSLEQYLMEGSYNKVFLSKDNVPSASYNFFIDILLRTIRAEIASCMEAAYKRVQFTEAGTMLYFKQPNELNEFAKSRNWTKAKDDYFYFQQVGKAADLANQAIPSNDMVMQMIEYAKEMELIV